MPVIMKLISKIGRRAHASAVRLIGDNNALAAVEFAMILPVMLVLFFGTVEFSSGVAIDRKVNLVAHTLSDLTSQSPVTGIVDTELTNWFNVGTRMMYPYSPTPLNAVISELYVDVNTGIAYVQWSKAFQGAKAWTAGTQLPIPSTLAVKGSYLILSEVKYTYTPTVLYATLPASIPLSADGYTRPRQSSCVIYPGVTPPAAIPGCPTTE
jgi:Flp pilus assembly protein TadG